MPRPSRRNSSPGAASQRSPSASEIPVKQRRQATVYDAVAGRVSSTGFIPSSPRTSKNRDTATSSTVPVAPEEVLLRRKGAPQPYEEEEVYWADGALTVAEKKGFPESDLLKAIHTYAADFYGTVNGAAAVVDYQSMDETALLGLGVLLEEMVWGALGQTGDLAFVEGEVVDEGSGKVAGEKSAAVESEPITPVEETGSTGGRRRKKRKTRHQKEDG